MYGLRDSLPKGLQGRIVIKVSKAKTDELVTVCKELAALEPQYGEPWIVFDRDRVVLFDQIIETANKEGIHVGWSNPCIEIWFDAYFGRMHSYQDSITCCREFADTFEKRTGQEYKKSNSQIYTMLNRYGDEAEAIKTAESRLTQYLSAGMDKPSKMCPCTTIHRLVHELKDKVNTLTLPPQPSTVSGCPGTMGNRLSPNTSVPPSASVTTSTLAPSTCTVTDFPSGSGTVPPMAASPPS